MYVRAVEIMACWSVIMALSVVCWQASGQVLDKEYAESRLCTVIQQQIWCEVIPLANQNISVMGTIEMCSKPIYLHFEVQELKSKVTSDYTFINRDESQRVLGVNTFVKFHVMLQHSPNYIFIKAGFTYGDTTIYFLDTRLAFVDLGDCQARVSRHVVLPVVLVSLVSLVAAVTGTVLLLWWYKRRRALKHQTGELLADMEQAATSLPYQEEPLASDITSPRPTSTTVIQNSVYRDSLVLETIPEENGQINEDDVVTFQKIPRSVRKGHKHGKKSHRDSGKGASGKYVQRKHKERTVCLPEDREDSGCVLDEKSADLMDCVDRTVGQAESTMTSKSNSESVNSFGGMVKLC